MTADNIQKPNTGFMASGGRKEKALKILQVIAEASPKHKQGYRPRLLDIGTGNGEIAHYLGIQYEVTSVDVADQRHIIDGFTFVNVTGESLPFPDQSFDIVVSNHVIEHVASADRHLAEIARVVRNDGLVYLATPNRLWPWEVHYQIPLLHYLPASAFMSIMKRFGRYHEDIFLLGWNKLKRKTRHNFTLTPFSDRITKYPRRYYINCNPFVATLLDLIPLRIYRLLMFVIPTLIVVLRKKSREIPTRSPSMSFY